MKNILFSVIVPVYNVEEYLISCIESVISQTYVNWELILVDDGSRDNSYKICKDYDKCNKKIFSYHKLNSGQMDTRRYGVLRAKGDYCIFLDSDDLLKENALEALNKYLEKDNIDCLIYGLNKIEKNNIIQQWNDSEKIRFDKVEDSLKKMLMDSRYNSLCRKAIRRDILINMKEEPNKDIRNAEDLLESINVFLNSKNILFIPDIIYIYRFNNKSVTHSKNFDKYLNDILDVNSEIIEYLKKYSKFKQNDFFDISIPRVIQLIDIIREVSLYYDKKKRNKIYNDLKEHRYYKECVIKYNYSFKNIGLKGIILFLFKKNMYRMITIFERIYRFFKKHFG